MRIWKLAIIFTVVTTLGLGIGLPVLANSHEESQVECRLASRLLKGTVDTIGEDYFTLKSGEKRIDVDDDTRFLKIAVPQRLTALYRDRITWSPDKTDQTRITAQVMPKLQTAARIRLQSNRQCNIKSRMALAEPPELTPSLISPDRTIGMCVHPVWNLKCLRQFAKDVEFSDLAIGDSVVVWLARNGDEPLAKVVLIMTPVSYQRLSGTIETIDESQKILEVEPKSNPDEIAAFTYNDTTTFALRGSPYLAEGDKVIITYIEENGDRLARRVTELTQ